MVAVDGSNVSPNASREAKVDYERLTYEIVDDARVIDAAKTSASAIAAAMSCRPSWRPLKA